MDAFFVSTGIVALAEMGDKTQLLALVLAARFRKPWLIVFGIFVATIANHAMAGALGAWVTTVVVFFLAEMGDKTQIATVMLAARFDAYGQVVAGTTLGMMLANAPVVWLGEKVTRLVPLRVVHVASALFFLALGVLALVIPAG